MLRVRILAVLCALVAASLSQAASLRYPSPPAIGAIAPEFKLVDQNGKSETLASARGKKVVLVFYRGYW